MATRLNPRHSEMVRDKIRASQLINALQNHVLGKNAMKATQIQAAIALLRKCVPDLTTVEMSGQLTLRTAVELSDADLADIASRGRRGVVAAAASSSESPQVH